MRKGLATILALASIGAGALALRQDAPWILQNVSPSSPLGFYFYTGDAPRIGDYLAFHPHGRGFERVTEATGLPMPEVPMLKRVIAGPGDQVCYSREHDVFRVNDGPPLGIEERAFQGRKIPLWEGCRALTAREYFVHSDRIPNSLDSRFYGPVQASTIVGTYAPLWIEPVTRAGLAEPTTQGMI